MRDAPPGYEFHGYVAWTTDQDGFPLGDFRDIFGCSYCGAIVWAITLHDDDCPGRRAVEVAE